MQGSWMGAALCGSGVNLYLETINPLCSCSALTVPGQEGSSVGLPLGSGLGAAVHGGSELVGQHLQVVRAVQECGWLLSRLLDSWGLLCCCNRCILCLDIPNLASADSCCPGRLSRADAASFIVLQPREQGLQCIPY